MVHEWKNEDKKKVGASMKEGYRVEGSRVEKGTEWKNEEKRVEDVF